MEFDFNLWMEISQAAATGGVGLYTWLATREKATNVRIAAVEERVEKAVDDHEARVGRIEERLLHGPTFVDIAGIYKRIDALHGDVREMSGKLDGLSNQNNLVMQHLIDVARP